MENSIQKTIKKLGFTILSSDQELESISEGLIHIYAEWSNTSRIRTNEVFDLLSKLDLQSSVNKYYLDNDLITSPKYIKMLNNHGYGETLIIKKGQIIYSTQFGKPISELIEYIERLK